MQSETPSRYATEDDRVSFANELDSQEGDVQYEEHGSPGVLLQEQSIDDGWDEADDIEQDLYDLERELEEANEARAVAEQVRLSSSNSPPLPFPHPSGCVTTFPTQAVHSGRMALEVAHSPG
jgi:hypothetical protein